MNQPEIQSFHANVLNKGGRIRGEEAVVVVNIDPFLKNAI